MKRLLAALAVAMLGVAPAEAAPVAYACEVSGAAGAFAFGFSVDAETRQATISWSGGHPWRGDEALSEDASLLSLAPALVAATFRTPAYAYFVRLDPMTGAAVFATPRDGGVVESVGMCGVE